MDKEYALVKKKLRNRMNNANKFDKWFKMTTLKIINIEDSCEYGDKISYRCKYSQGIRFWNPFTWVYLIIAILCLLGEGIVELVKELPKDLTPSTYTEYISIEKSLLESED